MHLWSYIGGETIVMAVLGLEVSALGRCMRLPYLDARVNAIGASNLNAGYLRYLRTYFLRSSQQKTLELARSSKCPTINHSFLSLSGLADSACSRSRWIPKTNLCRLQREPLDPQDESLPLVPHTVRPWPHASTNHLPTGLLSARRPITSANLADPSRS